MVKQDDPAHKYRKALIPYFSVEPFIMSNQPYHPPDNNGVLYTCTSFVILALLNDVKPSDSIRYNALLDAIEVEPGLIMRGPKKLQHQSHDDYIGVVAAGFLDPMRAMNVWQYGMSNSWIYRLPWIDFHIKQWFARMPGVVQTFKMSARQPLSLFDQLYFALDLYSTSWKKADATSGRILDWLKIFTYEQQDRRYRIIDKAIALWKKDIRRKYPNRLMGEIFEIYFRDKNHPFSVYTKGII